MGTRNPRAMERGEYIRKMEEVIHLGERGMHQAALSHDSEALAKFSEGFRLAQLEWLQAARGMSFEKANAVLIGFTMGEVTKWMEERRPGPPPSVLTLYDGPLSDEEFGKLKGLS